MIIRRNEDGTIDQVIGFAVLEDMGDGDWSLILTDDDNDRLLMLAFRGPLVVVEESEMKPCAGREHKHGPTT